MALPESGEDYLETILLLHNKTGHVRSVDIANKLGYSKPSVSRAMGILKSSGFIEMASDGQIILTDKGKKRADDIYSRHLLFVEFYRDVLGVSEETANDDACKTEHIVSEETVSKLREFVSEQKKQRK